jgi:hypothetical protein
MNSLIERIMRGAAPDAKPSRKKHKFALVACARWETESIVEWLVYHRHIGFDHVYLYCNDDDPAELYEAVLPFTQGPSPFVHFRHHPAQGEQAAMYQHFLRTFAPACEWFMFLDIDEFVVLRKGVTLESLTAQSGADAVLLHWAMAGTNGHKTRPKGPVWRNYSRRAAGLHPYTKPIIRRACFDPARPTGENFWHDPTAIMTTSSRIVDVTGADARDYYLDFPNKAVAHIERPDFSRQVFEKAFIFHAFMKSEEDALRRLQRGVLGSFKAQDIWRTMQTGDPEGFLALMASLSEVEESHLHDIWVEILRY